MLRNIYAFILAPFPAAWLEAIEVAIWPRPGQGVFEHPASMFVTICLSFYGFGLVFGIPSLLWLRRQSPGSLRAYAFAGALAALIGIGLLAGWVVANGQAFTLGAVFGMLKFALLGLLTGTVYWLIARPDRRAAIGKGRAKAGLLKTFE